MNTLHSIFNYVEAPSRACRNARKKPVMIAANFVIFPKALVSKDFAEVHNRLMHTETTHGVSSGRRRPEGEIN
jgi:hypothetical protein